MAKTEKLGVSKRTKTALKDADIETIEELKQMDSEELLAVDGVGEVSLEEIKIALDEWDDTPRPFFGDGEDVNYSHEIEEPVVERSVRVQRIYEQGVENG